MIRVKPVLRHLCPNCGGPIEASRLERGLPCRVCLPVDKESLSELSAREVGEVLARNGKLKNYAWVYDLEIEINEFKLYFNKKTGNKMWSAQESWAKRLLLLDSLAIIAPTGVGKTTLLSVYAAYRAEINGWKILYLVPTQNLVKQTASRIIEVLGEENVLYYTGSMSKKKREEILAKIKNGKFKVVVVTTSFLQRRFEILLKNSPFQLVIVDDVDSLLRSGANVERTLMLMGFSEETIKLAEKLVKAKLKFYAALASGKEDRAREAEIEIGDIEAQLRTVMPALQAQLVIASATGRPRGLKHLLFKELLGFEVGGGSDYMRSVTDSFIITEDNLIDEAVRVVSRLGRGGIIYVSQLHGKTIVKLLVEKLKRKGIRAEPALAGSRRSVAKLASGEADVIVGVASRYGVLVRGLDLPEVIKYAVFLDIPARRMKLEDALASPRRQLAFLFYAEENGCKKAGEYAKRIAKLIEKISDTSIVSAAYKGRIKVEGGLLESLVNEMREAGAFLIQWFLNVLQDRDSIRIGGTIVEIKDNQLNVIIPDAPTYMQASGRTSRLYKGVMTHGLSIVISNNKNFIEALEDRLKWYTDTDFKEFYKLNINNILDKMKKSRKGIGKRVNVKTILLIVESPTKAKTIAWFWGRPSKRRLGRLTVYETSTIDPETGTVYLLTVTATRGHLLDLAIDEDESFYGVKIKNNEYIPIYTSIKRCLKCGYTYSGDGPCPRCGSFAVYNAQSTLEALRKLSLEVDEVVIATDPDREGEKIAWDVYLALRPYNRNIKRGRFHEVTREAVLEAIRTGDSVNSRLVFSQIVRRIEDRWIGFALSKHLWALYGMNWLGAGRVQTPVLGWTIDRYNEWKENRGFFLVYETKDTNEKIIIFNKNKEEVSNVPKQAQAEIIDYTDFETSVAPPPPYTTDALLFDANRKLGYGATFTMKLAQELFESGLITYHRTDSTRISPVGIGIAKTYLEKRGLLEHYQGRSWGEGGAHEAIRPTRPIDAEELRKLVFEGTIRVPIKLTRAHIKLYNLIFTRFIASQMKPSKVKKAHVKIRIGSLETELEGTIEYDKRGFLLIDPPYIRKWLRLARIKDKIEVELINKVKGSSIKLYTTGDLVKLMKERKLGRPSTYAKVIEANRRHGYIILSKKKQYVIPTKRGIQVYSYLRDNFEELVSEETSRKLEELLDSIERGELNPCDALDSVASLIGGLLPETGLVGGLGEIAG